MLAFESIICKNALFTWPLRQSSHIKPSSCQSGLGAGTSLDIALAPARLRSQMGHDWDAIYSRRSSPNGKNRNSRLNEGTKRSAELANLMPVHGRTRSGTQKL